MNLLAYKNIVILGLGKTGLSCAKTLAKINIPFTINDSRDEPPELENFKKLGINMPMILGGFNDALLKKADLLIISQGIPLQSPEIVAAKAEGVKFISDVDLFAQFATAPIVAITGSNAKSTVTTLVGNIAEKAGLKVKVGGNLGTPMLDLLTDDPLDFYILELSNFQLELAHELKTYISCLLNITPDHMDRYSSFEDYIQTKQRIYQSYEIAIYCADDLLTYPKVNGKTAFYFSHRKPKDAEFGLVEMDGQTYLAMGSYAFFRVDQLKIKGKHNWQNALAASAIAHAMGIDFDVINEALSTFSGLSHRCQFVGEKNQIAWFNDSKGTNVGATVAAIDGIGSTVKGKVILIAGGQGKGADFTELSSMVKKYVREIVLFGQDADKINEALSPIVNTHKVSSLQEAIERAKSLAQMHDAVLFSPACASLDMFKNFEHRGNEFIRLTQAFLRDDH